MNEIKSYKRIGTEPHRSYYIPFDETDTVKERHGIVDRASSSRFISLDGEWQIKEYAHVCDFDINAALTETIPVPSSVQLHGYDRVQYLNTRYPIPVMPPHVPKKNPSWHYRKGFTLNKVSGERYYLNFEGVDSAFYLYVNGVKKGYSQISHATSEFDITDLVLDGENLIDVQVLKWSASTYLECQDKFRLSGIFRSVYLLRRPEKHIRDYKIETRLTDGGGILKLINESDVEIAAEICGKSFSVSGNSHTEVLLDGIIPWTSENPTLYRLTLRSCGEKIDERVGFRQITIEGCVFKVNGKAVKLKGVNRHEFNPYTGAAITLDDMVGDLEIMKELNVNAVRTSHYPNSPEFYLLTDRYGIYVMDEADLEMHGACTREGTYEWGLWREYGEDGMFSEGILDRHAALVERDKNRPCVIMWSLGNESSFGKAFFAGAEYIKKRDNTRPVHYESLQQADERYYFTSLVDVVSMMYPSLKTIEEKVLNNPEEKRPFVLCEYTHAMGNSSGDISDYWRLIYENEQMMGAFVWEWADHAIMTDGRLLYGGDFGEEEHDGNFCVDGLLTADRKIKSGALEMKAVYSGKLDSDIKDVPIPKISAKKSDESLTLSIDEESGEITSVRLGEKEFLKTPMRFNIQRYTDNDRALLSYWNGVLNLPSVKSYATSLEKLKNGYKVEGVLSANCMSPAVSYTAEYRVSGAELEVSIEYEISKYVKHLARFGVEFGVDSDKFSYIGYGPTESYVDKHVAAEYGYHESTPGENYDMGYLRPQESGSHYCTKYLRLDGSFSLYADATFSHSVNPYTTKQLIDTPHSFELVKNGYSVVCIDIAMRGVGSHSCGPQLDEKYEIPRRGKNTFKFVFDV